MTDQQKAFWKLIQTLNDNGVLDHVAIVGSWAEYIYQEANLLQFKKNLKTMDIDLFVPNINKPWNFIDLVHDLEERGYKVSNDNGFTRIDVERVLEVEFLVTDKGTKSDVTRHIHSLGVQAQILSNMDLFLNNNLSVNVNGYKITVPTPEAYVLQKLIINQYRRPTFKQGKDIEAVKIILDAINKDDRYQTNLKNLYGSLSNDLREKIDTTCQKHAVSLINFEKDTDGTIIRIQKIKEISFNPDDLKDPRMLYLFHAQKLFSSCNEWPGETADKEIVKLLIMQKISTRKIVSILSTESPSYGNKTPFKAKQDAQKLLSSLQVERGI